MEVNNFGFWDIAYRDNAPVLLGVLRRYVKDVETAQDLLHEVFITAIDKYDNYTGKGSFEGWLYRITVNTALMYLRDLRNNLVKTGRAPSLQMMTVDDDTDDTQTDGARAAIEAAGFSCEDLLSAIDRLPEHHKLVFNMYVMDDFSHKQIAAELHISPGTSKSHLARARKKIQQILYDDAMDRKKKKDRRWASAFLLLFPAKGHYIDRLFRDGLSGFRVPLTGGTGFMSAAIEQQVTSLTSVTSATLPSAAFWGSKLSYMAACCGTAAITGTVCWLSMSENSPLNRENDRMKNNMIVIDTLMYSPNPTPTETDSVYFDTTINDGIDASIYDGKDAARHISTDSTPNLEKKPAPVVIKKQIIQHQTVVVRDTIFIIE